MGEEVKAWDGVIGVAEAGVPSHGGAECRPTLPGGVGSDNLARGDAVSDFVGHSKDVTAELICGLGWQSFHGCCCG